MAVADLTDLGFEPETQTLRRDLARAYGDLGFQPESADPWSGMGFEAEQGPQQPPTAKPRMQPLPGPTFRTTPPDTQPEPDVNLVRDIARGVGTTFGGAGKIATAAVGDVARAMRGERPENIPALVTTDAAVQPGIDLPIETAVKESALEEKERGEFPKATIPARIALGLAKSAPKVGAIMGSGGGSLLAESAIAGGLFGLDDEGNFHPKEAVVGALLPGVGRVARVGVAAAIGKTLASGGAAPIGATGQKVLETLGEQVAMDAYMTAADAPEMMRLAKEDPSEFKARLAETIGSNMAFALWGAGKFSKEVPSATKEWVLKNADSLATKKVIESYSADQLRDIYSRVNAGQPATQAEKDLVSMINSELGKPAEAIKKGVEIVERGWPEKLARMLDTEAGKRTVQVAGEQQPVPPVIKPRGRSLLPLQTGEANAVNPEFIKERVPGERPGVNEVGQTPAEAGTGNRVPSEAGKPIPSGRPGAQAPGTQPEVSADLSSVPVGSDIPHSLVGSEVVRMMTTPLGNRVEKRVKITRITRGENTRGGSQTIFIHFDDGEGVGGNAGLQSDGTSMPLKVAIPKVLRQTGNRIVQPEVIPVPALSNINAPLPPVPEPPETIAAQLQMLQEGKRMAVMITPGEAMPKVPEGFAVQKTRQGTFIYNPMAFRSAQVQSAANTDNIGWLLSYGITRKPDPGTEIGAVVVRDKNGVEKHGVLTDQANLANVEASARRMMSPGDTIGLELESTVIERRMEAPAREFARTSGFDFKPAGVAGTEGLSPEVAAQMPRTWEFTDRRPDSPTRSITFYTPAGSSGAQIQAAYEAKKAAFAPKPERKAGDLTGMTEGELDAMLDEASKPKNKPVQALEPVKEPPKFIIVETPKGPRRVVARAQQDAQGKWHVAKITVHNDETGSYEIHHPPSESKAFHTSEEAILAGQALAKQALSKPTQKPPAQLPAPKPKGSSIRPKIPIPSSAKTAADIAKEAAKAGVKGADEALKGLHELFGGGERLGTGPSFDEETYAKAKPHFEKAYEQFKQAGKSLKEFFEFVFKQFGERIRPYIKRFIQELQAAAAASPADRVREIILTPGTGQQKAIQVKKLAEERRLTIKQAQELVESEMVKMAQEIAVNPDQTAKAKFDTLVSLYQQQPTMSARTSTSVENQAYSTPSPLSFAGSYMLDVLPDEGIYDGTAGNGMLLIGGNLAKSAGNEINADRLAALRALGVGTVTENDATKFVPSQQFPVVKLNPPFGSISNVNYDGFGIKKLEHLIALKGLEAMDRNGRAMLILGANMKPSDVQHHGAQWIFENYLYSRYNVVANFEVEGDLYAKQGAAWPVRVIVIAGRRDTPLPLPKEGLGPKSVDRLATWDNVWSKATEVHDAVEQIRQTLGTGGEAGISVRTPGGADPAAQPGIVPQPAGGTAPAPAAGGKPGGKGAGKPATQPRPAGGGAAAPAKPSVSRPAHPAAASAQPNVRGQPNAPVEGGVRPGADAPGDAGGTIGATGPGTKPGSVPRSAPLVKGTDYQSPYVPRSEGEPFGTLTPKSIAEGEHGALDALIKRVGPIDEFVANRLNMNVAEVRNVMAAEQIDGVALAIHQVETGGAIIIGDQTGIGKGRQAAAMIRYARLNDMIPVFFTKDPKLFTDMWGDLKDINTTVTPFIMGDPAKASIVGQDGGVIHKAPGSAGQKKIMRRITEDGMEESGFDAIFATYSQVNTRNERQQFLEMLAGSQGVMLILDEAHEAAGDSETSMQAAFMTGGQVQRGSGATLQQVTVPGLLQMAGTKQGQGGVIYLSATYAKRPDNTPVYFRTSLSKASQSFTNIVNALKRGGTALQQAMSEALAKAGQYVRRERSFDGVRYDMKRMQVADTAELIDHVDQVTDVLSQIRDFSARIADAVAASTAQSDTAVAMTDFASIVHNQIGQLLLAAKADAVVQEAIEAHGRGEKPLIALMNTMESFLTQYVDEKGIKPGDAITLRWNELLKYALSRTLRMSEDLGNGDTEISYVNPDDYGLGDLYRSIEATADGIESKFPISPIDYIIQRLNKAGVKMTELTGRESGLDYVDFEKGTTVYKHFKRANKNEVVNGFNGGKYDGMLLNASGSTGLSAHAAPKFKDQRPRHMIIAQAALDINVFMQTLGRIFRTGMITLGVYPGGEKYGARYTHMVLPLQAELKPAIVTARKMKSLNANTTAEADNAIKIDSEDLLNRYGDQIIAEYLDANPDLQLRLDIDVDVKKDGTIKALPETARKFTGRMALLPDAEQKTAYDEIIPAYRALIQQLKATGEYDLEIVVHDDWDALRKSDDQLTPGTDESNIFTASTRMQRWEIKDNRHVPTGVEMRAEFQKNTGGAQALGDAWRKFDVEAGKAFHARRDFLNQRVAENQGEAVDKTAARTQAERLLNILDEIERRWEQTQKLVHYIIWDGGQVIELSNGETGDRYDGMLVDVKFPKLVQGANPRLSPSAFKFKFMVDSPVGSVHATAAQFSPDAWQKDSSNKTVEDLNGSKKGARYERYFVVGNPIRGYEATGGRGKMVRFRTNEGDVVTGLLMPNNWGPQNLKADPRLDLVNGKAIADFLVRNPGETVECANIVRIQQQGYGRHTYTISTSAAKRTGGDIYLDEKLRKLTGDFNKTGNKMVAQVDEADLAKAADRLMEITKERFRPVGNAEQLIPKVRDSNDRANRGGRQGMIAQAPTVPSEPERGDFEAHSLDALRAALPHVGLPEANQRLLSAFLDSPLAKMLPEVRVRIADTLDRGWQGSYFQQVAEIARNADPLTGPHELLHAVWEILPDGIKQEIERMRVASIENLIANPPAGSSETLIAARKGWLQGLRDKPTKNSGEFIFRTEPLYPASQDEALLERIAQEAYPFSNANEFFAHSGSNRFKQRVGSIQEGFWAKVKQFIRDFIDTLKRALRLKPRQSDVLDRVLNGDFEPVTPEQPAGRQGSIRTREQAVAEGERERAIPTKVFGEPYYVLDREQINESTIAASSVLAKNVLTESGIAADEMPVTDEESGRERVAWVMTPQGRDMTGEGRRLIERFKKEISKSPPGKATQELANLINSVRINFQMGPASAMSEMSPDVRNELWRIAQSDASARGIALAALAGYARDIKFVGRNMDVELGGIWNSEFYGDELRRVIDELKGRVATAEAKTEDLQALLDEALRKKGRRGLSRKIGRGTKLSQKIIEIIKEGGDAWDILRELAIKNGWKVPTDEELARIRAWVNEWESLERLSAAERTAAGPTKAAREAALRAKMAVTEKRRVDLRKQIETAWTRFTKPFTVRTATGRANVTQAIGEFVSANLLLKVGFATRQTVDVLTQGAFYTPFRAVGHALGIHQKEIEAGRRNRTDVWQVVADTSNALKNAYYQRTKALGATMLSVGEVLRGHEQGKHVARLMGRVSIFDRAMQRADEMEARGKRGEAFLLRTFTLMRLGYRVAQAMDNLHGQPAVYQEMRQQVASALRENGMSRAEAETKADWVMGDIKAELALAIPQADLTLQANGIEADAREIKAAAYRLVQAKQYERMRALALPADEFAERNLELLDTLGWNEAEEGGLGGMAAGVMRAGGRLAGQMSAASPLLMPLSVPLLTMTRFGNAIGILINRKLSFTPLGFFPGAFGVNEADIDPETGVATRGSPWFRTEEDRRQRKVEASVGTSIQIALGVLAALGIIRVLLKWPKDKEERQMWDKLGWRPGQVHIPTGNGEHITLSMNTGPMVVMSPGLSAGGALHDLLEDRAKRQKRLDDEAAKLGLTPGKILPISTADMMGVAGNAAWGSVISGRTLSGLLGSTTEFGSFQPTKATASVLSAISPGMPGLQELDRLAFGTVLDSKMASVWDFMMPLPTSGAAQVNLLGDRVGDANGLQRVVGILTGGNYPLPVNDKDRQSEGAYRVLFESGYRPPSIDPGKAYSIGDKLRPFTGEELAKYTELRGKLLKEGLLGVDPGDKQGAKAAYGEANRMALDALGVSTATQVGQKPASLPAANAQGALNQQGRPIGIGVGGAGQTRSGRSLGFGGLRGVGFKRPAVSRRPGRRGPSVKLGSIRRSFGSSIPRPKGAPGMGLARVRKR